MFIRLQSSVKLNNMNNVVYGYKCFNKNLTSQYGDIFKEGKIYHSSNPHFGKNGFHMCMRLEDTLRYFDAFNDNIRICLVYGFGEFNEYDDEYNGYYDMYSYEYLTILKELSREEIINYALNICEYRLKRFISLYKLNIDEIELFKSKFYNNDNILKCIKYYQENNEDVYKLIK